MHKKNIRLFPDYIVVGAGLSGSVFANLLSEKNHKVLVIEKRDHVAGNCYDYVDPDTSILVSKYGAHIFHTNSEVVYEYITRFSKWKPYIHKVYARIEEKLIPVPVNISSVNKLFNLDIKNEEEMNEFLESVRDKSITDPKNSEEFCLMNFGKDIYEKLFKEYTKKQWDKYPAELDVSVLRRIPIRKDFSEGYFKDKYQLLPEYGYTKFVEKMLDSPNIYTLLNTDYFKIKSILSGVPKKTIYTGPIDHYYSSSGFDKLEYRSINFDFKKIDNCEYFQENSVINYPSLSEKFTRIVEYKHFYKNIESDKNSTATIISTEYTTSEGDPYYPIPNEKNQKLYLEYKNMADSEKDVLFIGRLASYKYYNMDEAIENSIKIFNEYFDNSL